MAFLIALVIEETGITLAEPVVGHVTVNPFLGQHSHVLLGMEAAIGGQPGSGKHFRITDDREVLFRPLHHRS